MSNHGTDATPGLLVSPPAALSFTRALKIHAFRLRRPGGDLLVYAAGGWPDTGDLAVRRYLGHWHEAAEGGEPVADSLDRLADLQFDVLAPWVSPVGAEPTVPVAPAEGRTRLLEAAERVRSGAA